MSNRNELLQSVARRIGDYRVGDRITPRTPELVDEWLQQFPPDVQEGVLAGLDYVLARTYISQGAFKAFLKGLANSNKLNPNFAPPDYWKRVNLLNIQKGGNSQKELLKIFDDVLRETHGFSVVDTGSPDGDFIYLDDCIGTGNRVRTDVCSWLEANNHLTSTCT